jgi:hypothetical protein
MQQFLIAATATAGLLCSPLLALADDGGPPPLPRKEFCKENPGKCEEARTKRREFCAANPEKCKQQREQMQARRAEMQARCDADPARCEEMKARRAEMQAKCKADPEKCEAMKQEARKKYQDWMGGPPSSGSKSGPKSAD